MERTGRSLSQVWAMRIESVPFVQACSRAARPTRPDAVRWQSDCVFNPLSFEELVNLRIGEPRVRPKIDARDFPLVPLDNRLQHALPAIGAVDVAGS